MPFRPCSRFCRQALALMLATLLCGAAQAQGTTAQTRDIEQQFRRGDAATAIQRLDQALAQQPGDAGLRFLRGVILSETGRSTEAAGVYERMIQDFPELPEPHNNLAVLQAAGGQLDQARLLLETALRLAPDYRTARENLGDVFVRLALRAYGQAAGGAPAEGLLLKKLAMARELSTLR